MSATDFDVVARVDVNASAGVGGRLARLQYSTQLLDLKMFVCLGNQQS